MKMVVVSDNHFYGAAFSDVTNCVVVTPESGLMIAQGHEDNYFAEAVVVLNIGSKDLLFRVLKEIMKKKCVSIFIEPVQWLSRIRVFYACGIFILPGRMELLRFIKTIRKCLLTSAGVMRIEQGKVKASDWDIIIHLMGGVSSRELAKQLNSSEKTISGRLCSLSKKMGLYGFNKATQVQIVYFFYLMFSLQKAGRVIL
ncbi:helix-turn-helix transcriptional regulator [Enterobacter ludwigii]|jgi:DNA-binding NarL/FixJ family response regulator|nr:hypothetical protein [Enterobacter asburiae]